MGLINSGATPKMQYNANNFPKEPKIANNK